MSDWRADVADYYDLGPHLPEDVPFYLEQISPEHTVLELGCGTGRVSIPLARHCAGLVGVDNSPAMLDRLRVNLAHVEPVLEVETHVGDITALDLGRTFDRIIAPFRVMQNLATDREIEGLLDTIRRHLAPGAVAILNAFNPNRTREDMLAEWVALGEQIAWEVEHNGDRIVMVDRHVRIEPDPLVLYPQLVYRRFRGDVQVDEATLNIAMRCHYPDELLALVEGAGFDVTATWGGYAGEVYGEGSELVVAFQAA